MSHWLKSIVGLMILSAGVAENIRIPATLIVRNSVATIKPKKLTRKIKIISSVLL
jgi:hypothetical protein